MKYHPLSFAGVCFIIIVCSAQLIKAYQWLLQLRKTKDLLTTALPAGATSALKAGQIQHRKIPSIKEDRYEWGSASGTDPHQTPRVWAHEVLASCCWAAFAVFLAVKGTCGRWTGFDTTRLSTNWQLNTFPGDKLVSHSCSLTPWLPKKSQNQSTARHSTSSVPAVAGADGDLCLFLIPLWIRVPGTDGAFWREIKQDFRNTICVD